MGISALSDPLSPTARAANVLLEPDAAPKGGGAAMITPDDAPICSPKRPILTADDVEIYSGVFGQFDKDRSGSIDAAELGSVLDLLGASVEPEVLARMLAEADDDGDGAIDEKEFLQLMAKNVGSQGSMLEGELRYAFSALDEDGSGSIDKAELTTACAGLGEKLSAEEVDLMLKQVDTDGSGEIDYDEFVAMARIGAHPLPGAADASDNAVVRRKFRSVVRMLVLRRRVVDTFARVDSEAYQWQRFCSIDKLDSVQAAIAAKTASVSADDSVLDALHMLEGSGAICLPVMGHDSAVRGFVHTLDIIGFLASELGSQFQTQISFGACDIARAALSGKQHVTKERAHTQMEIQMVSDIIRSRLAKVVDPRARMTYGSARIGRVKVAEIMQAGETYVRPCRLGFSYHDVQQCLDVLPSGSKFVPLIDWHGKLLTVLSQLDLLGCLAKEGCRDERVGTAADIAAEVIADEAACVPCHVTALAAFGMLTDDPTENGAAALAVVDEDGRLVGECVPESGNFIHFIHENAGGVTALGLSVGTLAASMQRGGQALPTCRAETPLHELLDTCVATGRSQVWMVDDASGRPIGMVTAAAILAAIAKGK